MPCQIRIATYDLEVVLRQELGQLLDPDRLVVPGGTPRGLRPEKCPFTRHQLDQRLLLFQQPRQQPRRRQPAAGIHPQVAIRRRRQDRPRFLQPL